MHRWQVVWWTRCPNAGDVVSSNWPPQPGHRFASHSTSATAYARSSSDHSGSVSVTDSTSRPDSS